MGENIIFSKSKLCIFLIMSIILVILLLAIGKKPAKKSEEMNIFCSVDDNNSLQTSVMLASLLVNTPSKKNITIHLVRPSDSSLSGENIYKLEYLKNLHKNSKLNFIVFDERKLKDFNNESWNKAILIKLFADEIFKDTPISKVLWLDDDIIITQDISELFQIDMGNKCLAATEQSELYRKHEGATVPKWVTAGIGLYNLEAIRKNKMQEKFINCCKFYTKNVKKLRKEDRILGGIEEYVLTNVIEEKDFLKLDEKKYCLMAHFYARENFTKYLKEEFSNAKIVHFAGFIKPWKNEQRTSELLFFYKKWDTYFKKTLFF